MITIKLIPLITLSIGIFLLIQVSFPLLNFKLWEFHNFGTNRILISPQSEKSKQVLGISVSKQNDDFPAFISTIQRNTPAPYQQFNLSVPNLKIQDARVYVDSNDLSLGLTHLPGTALPGEKGNVFISGHSALPLFFKGEKNAKAIFANLTSLKKGDQIQVSAAESIFKYEVIGIKVVDPTDLSVIEPLDNQNRYLTLMTCVPPGLNTKRLIVQAKLI